MSGASCTMAMLRIGIATKEAAFEAAVAAASLAIREGHEVHISVPGRTSGNQTALGAKDQN